MQGVASKGKAWPWYFRTTAILLLLVLHFSLAIGREQAHTEPMKKQEYTTKAGTKQYMPVLSIRQMMVRDTTGWCLKCGQEVPNVEPDARKYVHERCGEPKVYGLQELLLLNLVRVK